MTDEKKGIIYTTMTYAIWGILPIYWKQLGHVPSDEILTARIFWAFWTTVLVIFILGGQKIFGTI